MLGLGIEIVIILIVNISHQQKFYSNPMHLLIKPTMFTFESFPNFSILLFLRYLFALFVILKIIQIILTTSRFSNKKAKNHKLVADGVQTRYGDHPEIIQQSETQDRSLLKLEVTEERPENSQQKYMEGPQNNGEKEEKERQGDIKSQMGSADQNFSQQIISRIDQNDIDICLNEADNQSSMNQFLKTEQQNIDNKTDCSTQEKNIQEFYDRKTTKNMNIIEQTIPQNLLIGLNSIIPEISIKLCINVSAMYKNQEHLKRSMSISQCQNIVETFSA